MYSYLKVLSNRFFFKLEGKITIASFSPSIKFETKNNWLKWYD